jgi:ATP-dependent helicase/nuclease subunit A
MPELTPSQRLAVEDRGGSLLVSAAAGSGKTKVLVERLFRYITAECCNVDDFLVITYTKAAAAELRGRIASELSDRLARDPGDDHLRRQLLRVYRADIKTVDAFCTGLLRENTHLLAREEDRRALTPDFRVLDDNESQLLRQQVIRRTMENFYAQLDGDGRQLADTLGFGRDDGALTALVQELYEKLQSHAYPERWLEENGGRWEALRAGSGSFDATPYAALLLSGVGRRSGYRERLLRRAVEQMADCGPLARGYGDRFSAVADRFGGLRAAAESGSWSAAAQAAEAVDFPRLGPVKDAAGGELKLRMKRLWDGCRDEARQLQTLLGVSGVEAMEDLAAAAPAMCALVRLTAAFAGDYREEKLRRNAADFSDQEHLALRLLVTPEGAPTDLGVQISGRYREILVDEYQDTNEVQNAIFRAVSREGKNLFTVGDVKQSIYRFRLADPTIFLRKYAAFRPCGEAAEGEERKILLSRNFRSRREILDAVNFVFSGILSPEMGEMAYGQEEALHFGAAYYPSRQDCGTEYHLLSVPAQDRSEEGERPVRRLTAEARLVAGRIRQLLDTGFPVTQGDGSLRPCRCEDIVILMRSPSSRNEAYAQALAEQNIPCSFDAADDFFSTMEISVLLSLLQIIDNPRQDVPLISALRSPLFGFTPDRLAQIRGRTPQGDFYTAVEQDGGEDCRAFLAQLQELRAFSRDNGADRLLWHIYDRLNVLGVFGAMDGGDRRRENLIALSAHAEAFESSGYRGLFAFVTQLRRLLESGQAPATRGASGGGGVRLMSIHRSKGLEFPIVILTDLDRAFSRRDFDSPVLVHPSLGLGPSRVDLERGIRYSTLARRALEDTLRRENKAEEQRILYVAMTRAREKLILVDSCTHAQTRLGRLVPLAAWPAEPSAVEGGKSFGDWLLLALLCRPEAAPLRQLAGMEAGELYTGADAPWQVFVHEGAESAAAPEPRAVQAVRTREAAAFDPALLEFAYPYQRQTQLPAKRTATQLKGREADSEIAEAAARAPVLRPLSQPRFRQRADGLTPAESGTATHLALQYLDFSDFDVPGQVERLRARHLLSDEQAAAVDAPALTRFLHSPLARELRSSRRVLREYRFTLLEDAARLDPAAAGDRFLLQGVVDCCFETEDGTLTVVDFKTDRVEGEAMARRAEHYRPQIAAYSAALRRVLEVPVTRRVLYFLRPGAAVEVPEDGAESPTAEFSGDF